MTTTSVKMVAILDDRQGTARTVAD